MTVNYENTLKQENVKLYNVIKAVLIIQVRKELLVSFLMPPLCNFYHWLNGYRLTWFDLLHNGTVILTNMILDTYRTRFWTDESLMYYRSDVWPRWNEIVRQKGIKLVL